jgi:hypothetical protein
MARFYTRREEIAIIALRHTGRTFCRMVRWRWLPRGLREGAYDLGWALLMRAHAICNRATGRVTAHWKGGA